MELGEPILLPEFLAGGEPVAEGVVAAAGAFFFEEAAIDGAFEPGVDGVYRRPGESVPDLEMSERVSFFMTSLRRDSI